MLNKLYKINKLVLFYIDDKKYMKRLYNDSELIVINNS